MNLIRPELFEGRPSCVLFDLDNTMYAYDPCHEAGMAAVRDLAQNALGLSGADFDRCFAEARAEVKKRLGHQASSHNRVLYFQRTLERAGVATRPLETLQMEQTYWLAYLDAVTIFPDLLEFLDDLRLAGVQVVIVTDLTAQIQLRKIVALGLDRYIDWLVSSEEAGQDKPHPAAFEIALEKIGGVTGSIWMIGDNHNLDLVGAKRSVGACTLHFAHPGVAPAPASIVEIDGVISDFAQARRLLAATRAIA